MLHRLLKCQSGATAIEYALIAALIGLAIIGGATALGGKSANQYNNVANKVNAAMK